MKILLDVKLVRSLEKVSDRRDTSQPKRDSSDSPYCLGWRLLVLLNQISCITYFLWSLIDQRFWLLSHCHQEAPGFPCNQTKIIVSRQIRAHVCIHRNEQQRPAGVMVSSGVQSQINSHENLTVPTFSVFWSIRCIFQQETFLPWTF